MFNNPTLYIISIVNMNKYINEKLFLDFNTFKESLYNVSKAKFVYFSLQVVLSIALESCKLGESKNHIQLRLVLWSPQAGIHSTYKARAR